MTSIVDAMHVIYKQTIDDLKPEEKALIDPTKGYSVIRA